MSGIDVDSFGDDERERLIFMKLRACMDESGTHDQSPILMMGGVVSTFSKWRLFDKKWKQALDLHGVGYVHGKDLRKSQGSFRGWSVEKHNDFGDRLLDAAFRYVGFGLTVRLDRADFEEAYRGGQKPRKLQLQSAYGFLFGAWVEQARIIANALYADINASGIYVVLEDGPKSGAAAEVYSELKRGQTPEDGIPLKGFSLGNKSYPGLQLADMTAHRSWVSEGCDDDIEFHQVDGPVSAKNLKRKIGEPLAVYRQQLSREYLASVKERILAEDELRLAYGRRGIAKDRKSSRTETLE